MSINPYPNLIKEYFLSFLYRTIKQSYLGPSVDLARGNVRLLFSSMEEVVPTMLSQDQLVQGVSTDADMPLREVVLDGQADIIAPQLGTLCTEGPPLRRGVKKLKPVRRKGNDEQQDPLFVDHKKTAYVDKCNQKIRGTPSQDLHVRYTPSSTATTEEKMRADEFCHYRRHMLDAQLKVTKFVKILSGVFRGGLVQPSCSVLVPTTDNSFVCFYVYRFQPRSLPGCGFALGASSEVSWGSKSCYNP